MSFPSMIAETPGGSRAAGRVRRACVLAGERGAALVTVMAMIVAVLLVGAALFILATGEGDLVEYGVDDARALYLAEAGLEHAGTWLTDLAMQSPPVVPSVGDGMFDQALGGGEYSFKIVDATYNASGLRQYDVVSTGAIDRNVRQVRARYLEETFARFQWFILSVAPETWFYTGDHYEGPVHCNGHIKINGDPWFESRLTASKSVNIVGGNPRFDEGYEEYVPPIGLPDPDVVRQAAIDHGRYYGPIGGKDPRYECVLNRAGLDGYVSYRSYSKAGGFSDWDDVEISSLDESVIWFEEDVWIGGSDDDPSVLNGELTIGCSGVTSIRNDIIYAGSTDGVPDADCDDILGILGIGDIQIVETTPNYDDIVLHGAFFAVGHQSHFWLEDLSHWPNGGSGLLTLYGGVTQDQAQPFGMYSSGTLTRGYEEDFHYDGRMGTFVPPMFPTTDRYFWFDWQEIVPPQSV